MHEIFQSAETPHDEPVFEALDLPTIEPLLAESHRVFLPFRDGEARTSRELIETFQDDANFEIVGLVQDGKALSYAVALSTDKPYTLALGPMYVSRQHQGQGLGTKQVALFLQYAEERGFESVFTKTWLRNTASRVIFEGMGFTEVNVKSQDRIDGDSTISYVIDLY